jgi:hypothetical protein
VCKRRQWLGADTAAAVVALVSANAFGEQPSVARRWNEVALGAIRNDYARPALHARNLYHLAVAVFIVFRVA